MDNVSWILAIAGLLGVIVTFILGGWLWVVVGGIAALVIACIALLRTALRLNGLRIVAEERLRVGQTDNPVLLPGSPTLSSPTEAMPKERTSDGESISESAPAEIAHEPDVKPHQAPSPSPDMSPENAAWDAAYLNKDANEVDRLLEPWIESANDDQRAEREALSAYLQIVAGRHSALADLSRIADTNSEDPDVLVWLATAIDLLGEPLKAAEEIARRRPGLRGPHRMFIREARLRRRVGQASQALLLARAALASPEVDPGVRAGALIEEAYALEELGRRFESFASFEQALEIDPANADVRFHLAYQYSNANWRQLALTHYLVLKSQGVAGMASNNLGVEYHHFSLPILAVDSYRDAIGSSVALAYGNLAIRLIEGGFIDEAMAQISAGEKLDPANRMIAAALGRIEADRDAQAKKRDELASAGRSLREVFARFDLRTPTQLPSGDYLTAQGTRVVFTLEGDEAKGTYGDWAITAKLDEGYAQLSLKKGGVLSPSASGYAVSRDNKLVGYLVDYPNKGDTTPFIASATHASGS